MINNTINNRVFFKEESREIALLENNIYCIQKLESSYFIEEKNASILLDALWKSRDEEFNTIIESLPSLNISINSNYYSQLLDLILKKDSLCQLYCFIKKALELTDLSSRDIPKLYRFLFSKKNEIKPEEEQHAFDELKNLLDEFRKSPVYVYDRSRLCTSFISIIKDQPFQYVFRGKKIKKYKIVPAGICSSALKNKYKTDNSFSDPLESLSYLENIKSFYQRYRKINIPGATIHFLKEFPSLFMWMIYPLMSDDEIQKLIEFKQFHKLDKKKFPKGSDFNVLNWLIYNGYSETVEDLLKKMEGRLDLTPILLNWKEKWEIYKKHYKQVETLYTCLKGIKKNNDIKKFPSSLVNRPLFYENKNVKKEFQKTFLMWLNSLFDLNKCEEEKEKEEDLFSKVIFTINKVNHYFINNQGDCFSDLKLTQYDTHIFFKQFRKSHLLCSSLGNKKARIPIFSHQTLYDPNNFLELSVLGNMWNGNKVELIERRNCIHYSDWQWNHWESDCTSSKDSEPPFKRYQNLIWPTLEQSVLKILHFFSNILSNDKIKLVEICAGKGQLAKNILDAFGEGEGKVDYTLLEFNGPSILAAKKLLGERARVLKADVVNDLHFRQDEDNFFKKESVDIILGSGALTPIVLANKDSACTVLNKSSYHLKTGGFLVLSGLRSSFFSSEEFEQAGYKVINMIASSKDHLDSVQHYILQKSKFRLVTMKNPYEIKLLK